MNIMKKTCMAVMVAWCAVSAYADDSFASWAMSVRGQKIDGKTEGSWETGKLSGIAKVYETRMKANAADYEARILHAASIIAQLGENKNVSDYAKKFGCTLDYLGLKATVNTTAPSSWPAVNAMVDTFVKEAVPVLKTALADLEGVPSDWTGSVPLSADEYPVDEDVSLDIGDVLYARAGIEAAIGLAYFAQSYDLTTDWKKAKAAWDYQLTVPLSTTVPSMELGDAEGWDDAIGGEKFRIKMAGTKLYVKAFFSEVGEVNADEKNFVIDGEVEFVNVKTGEETVLVTQRDWDDEKGGYGEVYALVGSMENLEAYWRAWQDEAAQQNALRKLTRARVECDFADDGGEAVLAVDLKDRKSLLASGTWSIEWGELNAAIEGGGEYSGYDEVELDIDGGPDFFQKFLTEQTQLMAKLRNAQLLSVSKDWMAAAFNCVLLADSAVTNRTDDVMHFVEYDPIDAADVERGRNLMQKALAALDAPQEVDLQEEVLGERESNFDVSLLPNDGLMQVYLGALFEGRITRDLLPTLEKGLNEGPVPVLETIKDPTLGGLLPDFSVDTWEDLLPEFNIEVTHQKMTVKLDANGGKVTPATIVIMATDVYGELPEPTKAGGEFDGWWTAKDGGVQVQEGDPVDFSIFANAKTPTLYAQWRKECKITVVGGCLLDDWNQTTKSGLHRGDTVCVCLDSNKMYDKDGNLVNAFTYWTYTPAAADLGEGFNPVEDVVGVSMPNADVKLTANYLNGFAAWIRPEDEPIMVGEAAPGDFYWSIDNGKTLIALDDCKAYPVKAGKVTVKFYDKKGIWRASDVTITVDKRGSHKEGKATIYDEPETFTPQAVFVPVNNSTKVKLDTNGGSGSSEVFFANGYEYGSLSLPYRKGYVFAGWWTAKDGGEHITSGKSFDPADFAGQKTPTIYAHWLQMKKLTMKDESAYAEWYIDEEAFEDPELYQEIMESLSLLNLECSGGGYLEGKGVLEVLPGAKVYVESESATVDRSGKELVFQRWTVAPAKVNLGAGFTATSNSADFVMPDEDVTLQAAYIDESSCGRLYGTMYYETINLGNDAETGAAVCLMPTAGSIEWSVDGGKNWYKATMIDDNRYYNYGDEDAYFEGEGALLKAGKYTVTWRSSDPQWAVTASKATVVLAEGDNCYFSNYDFSDCRVSFIPQVVVDVLAYDRKQDIYVALPSAGSATMNPKDGLVPAGKTITLTAKVAKDYVFQGWGFAKYWSNVEPYFEETAATWKLGNWPIFCCGMSTSSSYLTRYIDPVDKKVHVVAAFKALKDYSADDIVFDGFYGDESESYIEAEYDDKRNASVTIKAVVGCAIDSGDGLELCCSPNASPLTYKLNGKLPDGLKFDAKKGLLSGAPKKAGNSFVTIAAIDPAKNSKSITVNFEVSPLPTWLAGEYRGIMRESYKIPGHYETDIGTGEEYWVDAERVLGRQTGILELTVKSDGKVSAKVITRIGTRSVSGTLSWSPANEEEGIGETFYFEHWDTKDDSECNVYFHFYEDENGVGRVEIDGSVDSYYKTEDTWVGGSLSGMRQDTDQLVDSPFLDKYYTFAFCATNSIDESAMQSGYGYLTLKTDKKGVAKVAGQLPDGEKVSLSALVMPFVTNDVLKARLYLFVSPSTYKKQDWFAMALTIAPDGTITSEGGAAWTPVDIDGDWYDGYEFYSGEITPAEVFGGGALYSEAATLENYYWVASCKSSENEWQKVWQQYSYKEDGETYYDINYALDFDGSFFNVTVMGDKKGGINLIQKSPAPWVEDGEWNYWADKKGNDITDPSQLSISFTKATGIFTGKASVYFDDPKLTSASLPYAGVIVRDNARAESGKNPYVGFGSAVYSCKYSYSDDYTGKAKTDTRKVTLPVSLEPSDE